MSASSLIVFATALAIAAIIPGPAVVALLSRVFVLGVVPNIAFGLGLIVGDLIWMAAAVFGLAALAVQLHTVFVVLKYVGVAYLLYLAWKLWMAPPQIAGLDDQASPQQATRRRSVWGGVGSGIAFGLSNPKPMLFYIALLPSLLDITRINGQAFAELSLVLVVVLGAVLAFYMFTGSRLRRLLQSRKAMRVANRGGSVVVLGTAAYVAARS